MMIKLTPGEYKLKQVQIVNLNMDIANQDVYIS